MLPDLLHVVSPLAVLLVVLAVAPPAAAGGVAAAQATPVETVWVPVVEKGLCGLDADGDFVLPRRPDVWGRPVDEFLGRVGLGLRP